MRFYNRETELERLAQLTQRAHRFAQFTTITGRRRVGKTELARQHLQDVDRGLYFFVDRRPSPALLNEFSTTLRMLIPHTPAFSDWQDFFVFLFAEAERKSLVVVFDEFQDFLSVDESVYSILQGVWDGWHKRCGIHLIAIGSVVGLMKRVFQDVKEPLYGRVTQELTLGPLPIEAVYQLGMDLGFTAPKDIFTLYGIFGGMPRYFEIIESMGLGGAPVETILEQALFSVFAPFRHEVRDIILSEFGGHTHTYLAILEAIATGKTRLSEIAGPAGMPATSLSKYMRELTDVFELVEREVPVTERAWRTKKSHYSIRDPFITFWMRFVYRQMSIYESGNHRYFLDRLPTFLTEFMGIAFEVIVKELLHTLNRHDRAPVSFHHIGRWWNRHMEIDLVAWNQETGHALFVECKWTSRPVDIEILHTLIQRSEVAPVPARHRSYLLVSRQGFSERLRRARKSHIYLWDLDDITLLVKGLASN